MKFSKNQVALTKKLNSPLQKKDFGKEIQATKNMIVNVTLLEEI